MADWQRSDWAAAERILSHGSRIKDACELSQFLLLEAVRNVDDPAVLGALVYLFVCTLSFQLPRPPFPTPQRMFSLNRFTSTECLFKFRFDQADIRRLATALSIPKELQLRRYRLRVDGIEALCILLHRLAYPVRYGDLVPLFGRSRGTLCVIFNALLQLIDSQWRHLLDLDCRGLCDNAVAFASAISQRSGIERQDIIGFLDGTGRPICRPDVNQRAVFSGHHRRHELLYQVMINPDGVARSLHGPVPG